MGSNPGRASPDPYLEILLEVNRLTIILANGI